MEQTQWQGSLEADKERRRSSGTGRPVTIFIGPPVGRPSAHFYDQKGNEDLQKSLEEPRKVHLTPTPILPSIGPPREILGLLMGASS